MPQTGAVQYGHAIIIGVGGASGSGKTTICRRIREQLGDEAVVSMSFDSYYHGLAPGEDPSAHNFDHPESLDIALLASHLQALKDGKPIDIPAYDFTTHKRTGIERTVSRPSVVFLDGIFTIACPEIRKLCDLTVFTVEDEDTCLVRRIRRDIVERGRSVESVLTQYETFVKPGFNQFVAPSMEFADVIIPRARENQRAQNVVVRAIMHMSRHRKVD